MKIAATKMSERGQFSCLENGTANFLGKLLLPPKKTLAVAAVRRQKLSLNSEG